MKDNLLVITIGEHDAINCGPGQREHEGPVWQMVFEGSQGLSHSEKAVLPGNAYPQGLDWHPELKSISGLPSPPKASNTNQAEQWSQPRFSQSRTHR